MKSKGNAKIVLLITFGLLILGVVAFFVVARSKRVAVEKVPVVVGLTPYPTDSVSLEQRAEETKQGVLADVSGGSSYGEIYIYREAGTMNHTVLAKLPDPPAGSSYEGWLVNDATGDELSTGVLALEKGVYNLVYTNETEDHRGYNSVVVTLEETVDDTPETHILEGMME